jgi:hypothetical protein
VSRKLVREAHASLTTLLEVEGTEDKMSANDLRSFILKRLFTGFSREFDLV